MAQTVRQTGGARVNGHEAMRAANEAADLIEREPVLVVDARPHFRLAGGAEYSNPARQTLNYRVPVPERPLPILIPTERGY